MEHDPTDLDGLLISEEGKAGQAQLQSRIEVDDFKWIVGNKRGRRFIHRLLDNAGVYRLSFVVGDPGLTAFNEGQRNTGLRILDLMTEHAPESYAQMLSEHNVR